MKLIDLLVQELPKRGGWPEGINVIEQNFHGKLFNGSKPYRPFLFDDEKFEIVDEWREARVTREQYEAALAAAQQPAWDGEGLPPVGCKCEALYDPRESMWFRVIIIAHDGPSVIGRWLEGYKDNQLLEYSSPNRFRTIRSEADKKRAAGVTALAKAGGAVDFEYGRKTIDGELSAPGWYELYDKIAAGEVAGIRIE
ncbi:hypothetical protein ACXDBF_001592 [Cronobacter sakazakii]|uniref:hypothetical protein n=1 Tax=Cronobacter sakazakii TaxID=28141 RepID=UPI0015C523B0|nr:hypothetical protein [Cronobacter sakazakii]